jgi:hypothetical protein
VLVFFNFSLKSSAAAASAKYLFANSVTASSSRRVCSALDRTLIREFISTNCNLPSFSSLTIKPSNASRFAADKRAFSSFSSISLRALINKSSIAFFSLIVS